MFMEELRKLMGNEIYYGFLKEVVAQFSTGVITGSQFLDCALSWSPVDLRPLIRRYFDYAKYSGALDYDLSNGHFYTQANGQALGASTKGFAVVDDGEARMWSEVRRLGGPSGIGYPISRRFKWDGFVSQAMQKGVLQWRPLEGRASLVNVFDEMGRRGLDVWLDSHRQVPEAIKWSSDDGRSWPEVVSNHQALLDLNLAIRGKYFSVDDPINLFGLPMSFGDMGNNYTLRAQRVVFQQWKVDVPWAAAGQVTVANGGDIAKEAGLLPDESLEPEDAP
jgi:hypothetical protein